jgi:hypothetical protein
METKLTRPCVHAGLGKRPQRDPFQSIQDFAQIGLLQCPESAPKAIGYGVKVAPPRFAARNASTRWKNATRFS